MHHLLLPPHFAALFGADLPELISVIVPVAGIVFGGVITVTSMYFKHQKQRMWHETARIALEKGQPIPAPFAERTRRPHDGMAKLDLDKHDLKAGLILIATGAGLALFLGAVGDSWKVGYVGAIPGLIGVALVLHWLFVTSRVCKKTQLPPPPQS